MYGLGQTFLSGQGLAGHPFLQIRPVVLVVAILQAQRFQALMVRVEVAHPEVHRRTRRRVHHLMVDVQGNICRYRHKVGTDGHHRLDDTPVADSIVLSRGAQIQLDIVIIQNALVALLQFDGLLHRLIIRYI